MVTTKKKTKKAAPASDNKFSGLEKRIVPVGDIPLYLKILVYGRAGTGKTTFIGSAPKPVLILDPRENGTKSVRKREGVDVLSVANWEDVEEVYWYLEANPTKYATVAIDAITPLQDMAISHITGGPTEQTSRRAFGQAASLLKTWIMIYRDLPMNVIFTAQDRVGSVEEIDDDGDLFPEIGPYVMPSVAKILNAAVDIIGQTFIREVEKTVKVKGSEKTKTVAEFCMRIGPHARYVTKLRRDDGGTGKSTVPRILSNPSFPKLLELSLNEEDE